MGEFVAQVDSWVLESIKRMKAVRNAAIEMVIDDAQLATAKGGRMRVDTGFLRASGQMSLNGMPTGPIRAEDAEKHQFDDGDNVWSQTTPIQLVLARASLGTDLYFGWSANYARARESHDGFLRLAVQKWPQFVDEATRTAKSRSSRK